MRRRLGGQDAPIEVAGQRAVMRAELHLVGDQRPERHGLQGTGAAAHRDDLVFVRAAAYCVDILPEELLNRIIGGWSAGPGLLSPNRRPCPAATLLPRPSDPP